MSNKKDASCTAVDCIQGTVFDIQDYSIHDGPGIRTVVFLKGCPLSCPWCSNPESQSRDVEIGFQKKRCSRCGVCISVCPVHAIAAGSDGSILFDRTKCVTCGRCVESCHSGARKLFGKSMSVSLVLKEVLKSAPFYTRSGGGVTFSGGEPILQFEFLRAVLSRCKEKYLHTAVETCGYVQDKRIFGEIAFLADLFLYDIKCIDDERHRSFTGVSNRIILENAQYLSGIGKDIILRVPIIPDFNDSVDDMSGIAAFAKTLGSLVEVNLLPFHNLGKFKYDMLDRPFAYGGVSALWPEQLDGLLDVFRVQEIPCRID